MSNNSNIKLIIEDLENVKQFIKDKYIDLFKDDNFMLLNSLRNSKGKFTKQIPQGEINICMNDENLKLNLKFKSLEHFNFYCMFIYSFPDIKGKSIIKDDIDLFYISASCAYNYFIPDYDKFVKEILNDFIHYMYEDLKYHIPERERKKSAEIRFDIRRIMNYQDGYKLIGSC
jgi:hypothetical protein